VNANLERMISSLEARNASLERTLSTLVFSQGRSPSAAVNDDSEVKTTTHPVRRDPKKITLAVREI
jgi:hypothetical protein